MAPAVPHGKPRGKLCLDGGLATTLELGGADLSQGKLWSARLLRDDADAILQAHRDFLAAGANIVCSATYQASVPGFVEELGVTVDEARALIGAGVILAKRAVTEQRQSSASRSQNDLICAASLGPHGALLADGSEYRGNYGMRQAELIKVHAERVAALVAQAPDVVLFETIPDSVEAQAIFRLMAENFPDLPFLLSFQCRDERCIADGTDIEQLVRTLSMLRTDKCQGIGVNCLSPELTSPLMQSVRNALSTSASWRPRTLCYPNSGEVWTEDGWSSDRLLSTELWARTVFASGADVVGGCCRTTPHHVRALRVILDSA